MRIDVKSRPAGLWRLDFVKVQQNVFAERAIPAMRRTMRELRLSVLSRHIETYVEGRVGSSPVV